ncbi:MAG TPA: glycosyltransferase [Allocoleopsis sp.]
MSNIGLGLAFLTLIIWVFLLGWRGQFWRADQRLKVQANEPEIWPRVYAIIPARNEADLLPVTLRSLLTQDYPGNLTVILVDDHSTDGTADVARSVGSDLGVSVVDAETPSEPNSSEKHPARLHILLAQALPPGWTGKLWALEQGICYAQAQTPAPDYILLTDADIEHDPLNLRQLVAKARHEDLDLVSLMVRLRCESFWERFLIPAFVFFFQKLYPFPWVNNPANRMAAAAGGCSLIDREALTRIGGMQAVRSALIDDCALAGAVKSTGKQDGKGRIWLGLADSTHSLRPYPTLDTIWNMVARTAFTQLNYSPWLLLGTIAAMSIIYLVPPIGVLWGTIARNWLIAIASWLSWLLMAFAYLPTVRYYHRSPVWALSLPAIAFLYTLMTLDSALRHWQKRGGTWKGRVYSETLGNG